MKHRTLLLAAAVLAIPLAACNQPAQTEAERAGEHAAAAADHAAAATEHAAANAVDAAQEAGANRMRVAA